MPLRFWTPIGGVSLLLGLSLGCGARPPADTRGGVFTPASESLTVAVSNFFGRHADESQPVEFPHIVHTNVGVGCIECHTSVAEGPRAGIPGTADCMACHDALGTDHPVLKQVAGWREQGIDVSWRRVFDYPPTTHVRFNHAPHIRARVSCETCHGDVAHQMTARRNVDLTMGFCVNCHRARRATDDCMVCHY